MPINLIAINRQTCDILLGKCKQGTDVVARKIVRELIAKTGLMLVDLPDCGADWHVQYALFTRASATAAARQELATLRDLIVDLNRLYTDLAA